MAILGRFSVLPLHAQVEVCDPTCSDFPIPETGEERVLSTAQCVVVATRSDADGSVSIEVRDDPAFDIAGWILAFDGELLLTEPYVSIGNYVANDTHHVIAHIGWNQVQIWTRPMNERPSDLTICLHPADRTSV